MKIVVCAASRVFNAERFVECDVDVKSGQHVDVPDTLDVGAVTVWVVGT